MYPVNLKHTRIVYNFLDLLGDLGGVTEVIMIVFGFFIFPISEHSFIMKATQKFFLARTADKTIFKRSQNVSKYADPNEIPRSHRKDKKYL